MSVNLRRVGLIAARDYKSVITSRSFLIGLFFMPVMLLIVFVLLPKFASSHSPQIEGEVALIDPTGKVAAELQAALRPAAVDARRLVEISQNTGVVVGKRDQSGTTPAIPVLTVKNLPPDAVVDTQKSWLIQTREARPRHVAIVVVPPDAVTAHADATFGHYSLYITPGIEDVTETTLRGAVRAALVAARMRSIGQDPAAIALAQQVVQPDSVIVAADGEHSGARGIARFMPLACGVLVFIGVLMGGQVLMTSTVEEKSNRVIEVLLAAVSPMELMYGKLLGQMALGLTLTAIYILLAMFGLTQYSLAGLLDPSLILYVLAFYVMTYLVFGSLMLTIGAAVNQIAEAQSLMGPVTLLLVVCYTMSPLVGAAPNSTLSVAMSFTPFVNTFAMLSRVASNSPPPAWEVWLTLLIAAGTAALVVWFASKVFKIALLMHGKPPSIATLFKWARMA